MGCGTLPQSVKISLANWLSNWAGRWHAHGSPRERTAACQQARRSPAVVARTEEQHMSEWLAWIFGFLFFSFYVVCLFTVCGMTFQKGRTLLGIVGIFLPFLWLIGAVLPAKPGSRWELTQQQL